MRIGFQARPYDLFLAAAFAAALLPLTALGVGGFGGIALAILGVFVLPGYGTVAALFPADREITWRTRITLTLAVSIAIVALVGVLSNYTPWGIRPELILGLLGPLAIGTCGVAYVRRRALPVGERLGLSIDIPSLRMTAMSSLERGLAAGLALAVAIAAGMFAYTAFTARPLGFTELYLLNESGEPADYPSNLSVGEEGAVWLVVVNRETGPVNYTIQIWLVTLGEAFNEVTGQNETVEIASVMPSSFAVPLQAGADERIPYRFVIDEPGDYLLKFLLYTDPLSTDPYRRAILEITVT